MNKLQSSIQEPGPIAGIYSNAKKMVLPFVGLGLVLTAVTAMIRHAENSIDATIGKQKNEEAVRKALAETGVEEGFCNVCEGETSTKTPIEKLPLKPFIETKNRVMEVLGHKEPDLRLTCESFPEGRKAIAEWNPPRFDSKRVPFCNQTRR